MSPVLCVICALLCVFVWCGGASRFIKYILEAFSAEMYRLFLCFLAFLFSIFGTLSLEAVFRGRNEHQFFSLTESFLWLATRDANSGISYFWCANRLFRVSLVRGPVRSMARRRAPVRLGRPLVRAAIVFCWPVIAMR